MTYPGSGDPLAGGLSTVGTVAASAATRPRTGNPGSVPASQLWGAHVGTVP